MPSIQEQAKDDDKIINSVNINAKQKWEIGSLPCVTFSLVGNYSGEIQSEELFVFIVPSSKLQHVMGNKYCDTS